MNNGAALHASGHFRYLAAGAAYSGGVVVEPGFGIEAWQFAEPRDLAEAFEWLDRQTAGNRLGPTALVGLHLRVPRPLTVDEFASLNRYYLAHLDARGLLTDGRSPVARTTVVEEDGSPTPAVAVIFLLAPRVSLARPDFVMSGVSEASRGFTPDRITAHGDYSDRGLAAKRDAVLDVVRDRFKALRIAPDAPLNLNVYTKFEVRELRSHLERALPGVRRTGYTRQPALPPVLGLDFEVDCARVSRWRLID
ncbi:2-amino-5-chloromuconate deaminase CnbZ [Rhizomonospora bruguierae]|uniref:2-amino-5-chloromuconate deaminase CnbZ n=1 Tax=Rhizomonospora bruguierae TaxID=1581705 RepID=UPI001BCC97E3|nr:hypothetical protein [Micromonospora sp. NBRC 107566]